MKEYNFIYSMGTIREVEETFENFNNNLIKSAKLGFEPIGTPVISLSSVGASVAVMMVKETLE